MSINKTADECIIELGIALLQCFADPQLSLSEKQETIKWITCFLDYQDAINEGNQEKIKKFQEILLNSFKPKYYEQAFKEFNNANIIYNNITSLKNLRSAILCHSSKETTIIINSFSFAFIKTMKKYETHLKNNEFTITNELISNLKLLFYTIHYHISYIFQKELIKIVKTLTKILKTKVKIKTEKKAFYQNKNENTLLQLILTENHEYFKTIQQIQLINFIHSLDDIFTSSFNVNHKIDNLIFLKPAKIKVTFNTLLKKHNIDLYSEIWKDDKIDNKKSNLLMHLFAYETYFLQGHNNHTYYEELILNKIITEEKYSFILNEYKTINKIHSIN